jgi:RNA polymerase sigma-70 factor (ECF subfamily)
MGPVDARLLGRVLEEHGAALELYARQWCNSPADVVQEALVALARQPSVPEPLVPWLFRVVRNGAVDAGRRERRRRRYETAAAGQAPRWFRPSTDAAIDAQAAAEALAALSIDEREPIVAHLWGGLTFEQIAALAGSSPATAYRRYQAGLQSLRQRLGIQCPTNDEN